MCEGVPALTPSLREDSHTNSRRTVTKKADPPCSFFRPPARPPKGAPPRCWQRSAAPRYPSWPRRPSRPRRVPPPLRSWATRPTSTASASPTAAAVCRRRTWTRQDFVALNVFNTPGDYDHYPRPVPADQASHHRHLRQRPQLRPLGAGHHRRLLHRHQRRRPEPALLPQRLLGRRQVQRRHPDHAGRRQLRRLQRLVPGRPVPPRPGTPTRSTGSDRTARRSADSARTTGTTGTSRGSSSRAPDYSGDIKIGFLQGAQR